MRLLWPIEICGSKLSYYGNIVSKLLVCLNLWIFFQRFTIQQDQSDSSRSISSPWKSGFYKILTTLGKKLDRFTKFKLLLRLSYALQFWRMQNKQLFFLKFAPIFKEHAEIIKIAKKRAEFYKFSKRSSFLVLST